MGTRQHSTYRTTQEVLRPSPVSQFWHGCPRDVEYERQGAEVGAPPVCVSVNQSKKCHLTLRPAEQRFDPGYALSFYGSRPLQATTSRLSITNTQSIDGPVLLLGRVGMAVFYPRLPGLTR
ncbi:hypothetical protein HRR77_009598 [Exophiala dermatitidis]|nr:hypothetical protein HRR77_009598 [Exophiala dermatitidis]KAJ4590422.1 hypothetical protein HRR82_009587 [Exophiala dermatitidis]KAJ4621498.1 hypothetical protein HRR85_009606 [Exophiala dermatitidis]